MRRKGGAKPIAHPLLTPHGFFTLNEPAAHPGNQQGIDEINQERADK